MDLPQHKLPRFSRTFEETVRTHCFTVDPTVRPADLNDPRIWVHMAERFAIGHEVLVKPTDYSYRFHAEVVAVDPAGHWAAVRVISLTEGLPFPAEAPDESGYSYNKDPVMGYRVLRYGKDVIASGLPDEAAAVAEIEKAKLTDKPKRVA